MGFRDDWRRIAGASTPRAQNAAAIWFLFAFPVLAGLFNRGHLGLVAIGLVLALATALLSGKGALAKTVAAIRQSWIRRQPPFVYAVLVLAFLSALSACWAIDPGLAVSRGGALVGIVLLALALGTLLPEHIRHADVIFAASGLALIAVFIIEEFLGPSLYGFTRAVLISNRWEWGDPMPQSRINMFLFQLNRSVVTLSVLAWPVITLMISRGYRRSAVLVAMLVVVATFGSTSQAAMLAVLTGIAVFMLARLSGGVAIGAYAVTVAGVVALLPFIAHNITQSMNAYRLSRFLSGSADIRMQYWQDFSDAALQKPWLGWGTDAGRFFGDPRIAANLQPTGWPVNMYHHPHNAMLQAWVDFGLMGALVMIAICLAAAWSVWKMPERYRASAMACLAAVTMISFVSHGLWQTWWLMLLGIAAALYGWITRQR